MAMSIKNANTSRNAKQDCVICNEKVFGDMFGAVPLLLLKCMGSIFLYFNILEVLVIEELF